MTGTVMCLIGSYVFELAQTDQDPLLVMATTPGAVEVDQMVQATGRVRTLRIDILESELEIDLDETRLRAFEGSVVLVSTAVQVQPPSGR